MSMLMSLVPEAFQGCGRRLCNPERAQKKRFRQVFFAAGSWNLRHTHTHAYSLHPSANLFGRYRETVTLEKTPLPKTHRIQTTKASDSCVIRFNLRRRAFFAKKHILKTQSEKCFSWCLGYYVKLQELSNMYSEFFHRTQYFSILGNKRFFVHCQRKVTSA